METVEHLSGVRARLKLFEEQKQKPEFANKHRVEKVGRLDESKIDVSKYASTVKVKQSTVPADMVNPLEASMTDLSTYKSSVQVKQSTVPADMVNSLDIPLTDPSKYTSTVQRRSSTVPADMVNKLSDTYLLEFEPSESRGSEVDASTNGSYRDIKSSSQGTVARDDVSETETSNHNSSLQQINSMRPSGMFDSSFAAPDEEEVEALDDLTKYFGLEQVVADKDSKEPSVSIEILRERYLEAISRLQPKALEPLSAAEEASPAFKKRQKQQFQNELEKSIEFEKLRAMWDRYEDKRKDRRLSEPSLEDKKVEEEIKNAENALVSGFSNFADQVEEDIDDEDSVDETLLDFIEKAQRMRALAEKRRKKKEKRAKRRKARLEEEKLMREDRELLEEAKRLREAAKLKKKEKI